MKENKDGKSETITINVKKDLRTRIDALKDGNIQFSGMLLSNFLGYIVGLGVKEAEIQAIEEKKKEEARLEASSKPPVIENNTAIELQKINGKINLLFEAVNEGTTVDDVSSPTYLARKRKKGGNSNDEGGQAAGDEKER